MARPPNQVIGPLIKPVDPGEFVAKTSKSRAGRPLKLKPEQEAELLVWWRQRRALGSIKSKCESFGIAPKTLWGSIERALARELVEKRAAEERCASST